MVRPQVTAQPQGRPLPSQPQGQAARLPQRPWVRWVHLSLRDTGRGSGRGRGKGTPWVRTMRKGTASHMDMCRDRDLCRGRGRGRGQGKGMLRVRTGKVRSC